MVGWLAYSNQASLVITNSLNILLLKEIFMGSLLSGIIVGFREGLEAFLIIVILLRFLLGYGLHEGLSALKDLGTLPESSPLFIKAFNLGGTVLDHKTGMVGLPLYVLLGWYSRPEIPQFALQYLYTGLMLFFWYRTQKSARTLR